LAKIYAGQRRRGAPDRGLVPVFGVHAVDWGAEGGQVLDRQGPVAFLGARIVSFTIDLAI